MKLGRLPAHDPQTHPRLRLGDFLRPDTLPAPPTTVDWLSQVTNWPMYGNADWGDCVWAMLGHAIEAYTRYGQGTTAEVTDADVLKGYSDVTGFDPHAGPPGSNPTDQGTVIQDALDYWRKVGVGGHKILAFAQVDHTNPAEVDAALNIFGHVLLGINFPASAMTQFNDGQPWDVVGDDGGIEGGHAIDLGFDAATRRLKVVTWARVQDVTPAFHLRYCEEAWVACSPEWVTAAGGSPAGLDVQALNAAFTALTGESGPFPVAPTPVPAPPPPPAPVPVPDDADRTLSAVLHHDSWIRHGHGFGETHHVVLALRAWLAAKGL